MQRVYKYETGQEVPEGAVYLTTVVEEANPAAGQPTSLVWHYFLVEDLDK